MCRPPDRSCTVAAAIAASFGGPSRHRDHAGPEEQPIRLPREPHERRHRVAGARLGQEDRRVAERLSLARDRGDVGPRQRVADREGRPGRLAQLPHGWHRRRCDGARDLPHRGRRSPGRRAPHARRPASRIGGHLSRPSAARGKQGPPRPLVRAERARGEARSRRSRLQLPRHDGLGRNVRGRPRRAARRPRRDRVRPRAHRRPDARVRVVLRRERRAPGGVRGRARARPRAVRDPRSNRTTSSCRRCPPRRSSDC